MDQEIREIIFDLKSYVEYLKGWESLICLAPKRVPEKFASHSRRDTKRVRRLPTMQTPPNTPHHCVWGR